MKTKAALSPKMFVESDPSLLTTTIDIVVTTGSTDDPPGKAGLTSLLAELLLRGTKKRPRDVFQSELEKMGAVLQVRVGQDIVVFTGKVIQENTFKFLKLIEDFLLYPSFSKKEFDALKTETLASISDAKNSNARLASLAVRREVFGNSVLEQPVDGTLSSVKKIKLEDLIRSYNNQYHRGNFVFGVATGTDEKKIRDGLTKIWLKFVDGARLTHKSIPPKVPSKPTLILVHKPKTSTGSLVMVQPGITAQDPLRYTLRLGDFSFGGEALISRLFRIIRGQLGYTYGIRSTYQGLGSLSQQQGLFTISAIPSVEFTTKSLMKILFMWRDYYKKGLLPDELSLAQDSMINSYPFEFDSAEKRLILKLHSYLYNIPVPDQAEYTKILRGIDNDQLVAALKQRQSPDSWLIALVADEEVIRKQLEEEQAQVPEAERITISKVIQPEELVE